MACLLALTALATAAAAMALHGRTAEICAPVDRFLDQFGHDAHALSRANESPPL